MDAATLAASATAATSCFPDVGGWWPQERAECFASETSQPSAGISSVVEVHDERSVVVEGGTQIQPVLVETMVEASLKALTGDNANPWRVILPDYTRGMRVGFKVNCLNEYVPTSPQVIAALCASLRDGLGIDGEEIIVWDRRLDELSRCGFDEASMGARVMGTVVSTRDTSGPGYERAHCVIGKGKSTRLSRILTELTDVTINCPVLKTHSVSGVTGGLKNVYGVIDNPGDFHHDLPTALPSIFALNPIRRRLRLTVLDALTAVIFGDTSSPRDDVPHRLLTSYDPVAMDSRVVALVNQRRLERSDTATVVNPERTTWLENAHALGLGALDYDLIEATL